MKCLCLSYLGERGALRRRERSVEEGEECWRRRGVLRRERSVEEEGEEC